MSYNKTCSKPSKNAQNLVATADVAMTYFSEKLRINLIKFKEDNQTCDTYTNC